MFVFQVTWIFEMGTLSAVLPAKSDSDVMLLLQSHPGLSIDRSLVYYGEGP